MLVLGHSHVDPDNIFKIILNAHHLTLLDRDLLLQHLIDSHDPHFLIIQLLILLHQLLELQLDCIKFFVSVFYLVFKFNI